MAQPLLWHHREGIGALPSAPSIYATVAGSFVVFFAQLSPLSRLLLALTFSLSLSLSLRYHHSPGLRKRLGRSRMVRVFAGLLGLTFLSCCHDGLTNAAPTTSSTSPVYTIPAEADFGQPVIANIIDPEAVDPQSVCPGYTATNVQKTSHGLTADLHLAGKACNAYGTDIDALALTVEYQAADRLHVQVLPRYIGKENSTWFILPEEVLTKPTVDSGSDWSVHTDLDFSWSNDPSFSFKVTRKSTNDVLFSTEGTKLVYEDQFIEFASALPKDYNLYGLGETIHSLRLGNNLTRTLYAADVGDVIDANLYGSHPFYMDTRYFEVQDDGHLAYTSSPTDKSAKYKSFTHGVFQRNAHGQEILLRDSRITWRALGGSIDLYFYQGPTQDAVTKAYQKSAIGLPAMQQYWTFGYHQCRWGYTSWDNMQEVIDSFERFQIPLETVWSDIDYMKGYRDFDNDPINYSYKDAAVFLERLHKNNQHYVPIIDSAVYAPNPDNASDAYPPYNRGLERDAFLTNPDGSTYIGAVWPGYTVFPDWVGALFNGSGAIEWWISEVSKYHDDLAFDGIWIDMSEVSSFCVGSCGSGNLDKNPAHPPFLLPGEPGDLVLDYPEGFNRTNATEAASASAMASSQSATATATASPSTTTSYLRTTPTAGVRNINYPPYTLNNYNGDLAVHAVSPNATHHGGTSEYDFHNLYGHMILNATYESLLKVFPEKRPFIIGRSQFAGSGKWAGHWGGDNYSLWAYMYFSIPQALSFSLYGFPMFGVDTCGFAGNSDLELCSRWMQLSAFFPFYRNHNTLGANSQEPYVWSEVADASKAAMKIRYALLPYIYTTFYQSHSTGSTTMRALAWEFPDEPWLADADRQFLLGDAIMVTPCLEQGASTVGGVFPGVEAGTTWYDWYNQTAVSGVSTGQNVTIDAPLGHIPVYVRGGHVVPMQEPALTTTDARGTPWSVLVALDEDSYAQGSLYLDDGESLSPDSTTWVDFALKDNTLSATPKGDFADANALSQVTIMGVKKPVSTVKFNGLALSSNHWTYDESKQLLTVHELSPSTTMGAWHVKWLLSWS